MKETVVTVVDLEPPAHREAPPSSNGVSSEAGVLEGALLVAVGLASIAVEGVARAIASALGERSDVEGTDTEAERTDEPETLAVVAGAGLSLALGSARVLARVAAGIDRALRPLSLVAMVPPVDRAARRLEGSATRMDTTWQAARSESERAAEAFADALLPELIDAVIDRLDLTKLVLERVDLDAVVKEVDLSMIVERIDPSTIVERLDIDAVAARVDVQRIVDSLDLVAIARGVIDELDLPEIIRSSTETMAAETRDGVRVQSVRADRFVTRLVDRALLRENGAPAERSGTTEPTEGPS